MGSTNPVDYSLSVALTNVAAMRKDDDEFIASSIMPLYSAPKKTGNKIWAIDPKNDSLRAQDDLRAPGTPAAALYEGTPTTPIEFTVDDHSLAAILPDELLGEYDTAIRAEANKTERLVRKLRFNYEAECIALYAAGTAATTPVVKFDDWASVATTSTGYDPIEYIMAQFGTIEAATGATPNTISMDIATARAIIHNPRVRENVKYILSPSEVYRDVGSWKSQISALLGVPFVNIARSSWINTAKKGQVPSLSRMWGKHAFLSYQENPSVEYAGLGLSVVYTGPGGGAQGGWFVETGRLARSRSEEIIAHWYRKPVIVNAGAGVWLPTVMT